jgi:hypothetical protein
VAHLDAAGHEIDFWSEPVSTFGPVAGSALDAYVDGLERQIVSLSAAFR